MKKPIIAERTRRLIIQGATLSAQGHDTPAIAKKLNTNVKRVCWARHKYRQKWNEIFDANLASVVAETRLEPNQYLKMVQEATGKTTKPKTRELVARAIPLLAQGRSYREVAILLNTKPRRIAEIKARHKELWEKLFRSEQVKIIESGGVAGRPRTTAKCGEASKLLAFFHQIYIPSRLDLSDDSIYQFDIVIRQFEEFCGQLPIEDFTDEIISSYLRHSLKRGLAPATVNSQRAKLLALWRCAWRKRLHPELPRDIPRARLQRSIPTAWSAKEVQQLVTFSESLAGAIGELPAAWWWTTLFLVSWETGLRIGALLKLRVSDVKLDVPAIVAEGVNAKTGVPQFCPLTPWTAELLAQHLSPARNDFVWPWPHHQRYVWVCARRIIERRGAGSITRRPQPLPQAAPDAH